MLNSKKKKEKIKIIKFLAMNRMFPHLK